MITTTIKQLVQPEPQIEYDELVTKYRLLKLKYKTRTEKYKAELKSKYLLSKQIHRWSRRYQRLKITIAASAVKTASFEDYVTSVEGNNNEVERLQALVLNLSVKNNELEQELEQSKIINQAMQWTSKKSDKPVQENPTIVFDFPASFQNACTKQVVSA